MTSEHQKVNKLPKAKKSKATNFQKKNKIKENPYSIIEEPEDIEGEAHKIVMDNSYYFKNYILRIQYYLLHNFSFQKNASNFSKSKCSF